MPLPGPRVAVITPYFRTPDAWLIRCHESVRAQTYSCTHILVSDGEAQDIIDGFECQHIRLSKPHADYGDTPRSIGSMSAIGQQFDAITYLDADNWYDEDHIASLVALYQATGAVVCTSRRRYVHLDGSRSLAICLTSDGEMFCDTSCLMLFRPAFSLTMVWASMNPEEHAIDDRVVWHWIRKSGHRRANTGRASLAYRATHANIYMDLKESIPEQAKYSSVIANALALWERRGNPSLEVKWKYAVRRTRPRVAGDSPTCSAAG